MTQPGLQRNFLSGWRRWMVIAFAFGLVMVVVLSLALWRQATMAKDCRQARPLPQEVRLVTPGTEGLRKLVFRRASGDPEGY